MLVLLDSFALFPWSSLQNQDGKTQLNSDWLTILMLDVQNEFRWDQDQGVCGMASEIHAQAFLCFAEPLSSSEPADQHLSVSYCTISASVVTVLRAPRRQHRWPGIIYLHSEFIRNHPVSLATGLGSRYRCLEIHVSAHGCYSVYHTPPGSSSRNHSLQSSVADAVGVPPINEAWVLWCKLTAKREMLLKDLP